MSLLLPPLARRLKFVPSLALAAVLAQALPLRAAEQAITMAGVARSASLMEAIVEICPPYGADADLAGRYAKAFVTAGSEAYGKKRFASALQKERARRRQEVNSSAAAAWCEEQKEMQQRIGDTGIFKAK